MAESVPEKVKRTLYRGDDRDWWHVFEQLVTVDGVSTWEPYDITDWTFLSQFRPDRDRGTMICESTVTVFDGPNGIAHEMLPADQADLLPGQPGDETEPAPKVFWDIQSTDENGKKRTWKYAWCPVGGDGSDD